MPIACPCPACGTLHPLPASAMGNRMACRGCGDMFRAAGRCFGCREFVIYDLETTGLYPDSDEFIQIAAVKFRDGDLYPAESFHAYAKPRHRIPSFIEQYTGVTNSHVRDAARPEDVLRDFASYAGEATLIAHNGKRFDSKFLQATCLRHGLPHRKVDCIDSIHLSKLAFGRTRGTGHSMDHLISRLGLGGATFRRHDARGDVEILGMAVAAMHRILDLDHAFNGVERHDSLLPV